MSSLFKECMSLFTTGVTVITTESMKGITINSFCSLSLEPMMILFNLEKRASRFTTFHQCNKFVVNILSEEQQHVSHAFAQPEDSLNEPYLHLADENEPPIIKEAMCHIYCEKYKTYDGGDHKIILGSVYRMKKNCDKKPLVYYKSNYYSL